MKKILFFFLGVSYGFFAISAEVEGFGSYKIGMAEKDFLALPDISSKNLLPMTEKSGVCGGRCENDLFKRDVETKFFNDFEVIRVPGHVVYRFKAPIEIGVGDKPRYDFYAHFLDGKLLSIVIRFGIQKNKSLYFDLANLLAEKYGKGEYIDDIKKITCANSYGLKVDYDEGKQSVIWNKGKKVEAQLDYYQSNCKPYSSTSYVVSAYPDYKELVTKEVKAEISEMQSKTREKAEKSGF